MDINNPDTWSDDPAEILAALDKTPVEALEPDRKAAELAPAAVLPAAEPVPAAEATAGTGTGGDKLVPVSALAELRAEVREQRKHAEDLERQLADLRDGGKEEPAASTEAPAGTAPDLATLTALLAEAKADGDTDWVASLQAQIDQVKVQQAQDERLARLEAQLAAQTNQVAKAELTAALASAPLLQAWAADTQRPLWHRTAVQLHAALAADPQQPYARLPLAEQFARLPELVEAQLGVRAPHRTAVKASEQPRGAGGRFAAEADAVPLSMSGFPGGVAKNPPPQTGADMSLMEPGEQREYLLGLADDPNKLLDFLDTTPFGSLNGGSRRKSK